MIDVLDLVDSEKAAEVLGAAKTSIVDGWNAVEKLLNSGFSEEEIASAFLKHGTDMRNGMNDMVRAKYLKTVSSAHSKIARGIAGRAQLARLLA